MSTDYLTLATDLPGKISHLNRRLEAPQLSVSLPPSRTRTALVRAAETWRRRCHRAGEDVGEHLGHLERFSRTLVAVDEHTAADLAGLR